MIILGLSAYYHDSAAALIRDGDIVAAAQEERFTRKKNDAGFPENAARWCLAQAGITGREVDHVAFYDKPFLKFERLLETYIAFAPGGFTSFCRSMPVWIGEKLFQKKLLLRELSLIDGALAEPAKLLFAEHHFSHAASAFFPSPFDEAAVLTIDGVGEWATTTAGVGKGAELGLAREIHFPHSLGLLYAAFTYYTGFKVNSDEYKVMGLAPYGETKYVQTILDNLIDLKPDGSFRLNLRYFDYCTGLTMTNAHFDALFGGPPRKRDEPIGARHMDLAASIQAVLDEAMLRLTRALAAETGLPNLCLAGGVALNCVANGKVLRDGRFRNIWIQPAAGDAGGALGAALAGYHLHCGRPRRVSKEPDAMKGACLGPSFEAEQIRAALDGYGAIYREVDDDALLTEVVDALIDEKVIGWFQGRMEFGPRALGNRSILADARSPRLQRELNLRIKYRESFRPFAPAVLRENASKYFELAHDSPYMLLVAPVRAERRTATTPEQDALRGIARLNVARSNIPAVTHIDYSARIQTVDAATNPRFHRLLSAMHQRTGTGVLVNTSFNVRDEPIVLSPEDAYRCFMATEMDMLVLGNAILRKDEQLPRLIGSARGDALIPSRLMPCLTLAGAGEVDLERVNGAFRCPRTGKIFPDRDGIPSLLAAGPGNDLDPITGKVKAFYEEHPFPNYDGVQEFGDLVNRGLNNPFAKGLLDAIGCNKLILECGCGTGQLSHFLSLNNNHVLGVDLSLSSLKLAVEHKLRNSVSRVGFVQMNVFELGVKDTMFDVVISTGVLHHTRDARGAIAALVRKAKPGGLVVVGLYNRFARVPTWVRAKLIGTLGPRIDYVVRRRIRDPRKAEIWIKDQYYNPHESWHSVDEVLHWFAENDVSYLNCRPAILGSGLRQGDGMFAATSPGSRLGRVLTQLSWLGSIAAEGALFVMIGRRNAAPASLTRDMISCVGWVEPKAKPITVQLDAN
jgi:carbamoyltransferase